MKKTTPPIPFAGAQPTKLGMFAPSLAAKRKSIEYRFPTMWWRSNHVVNELWNRHKDALIRTYYPWEVCGIHRD